MASQIAGRFIEELVGNNSVETYKIFKYFLEVCILSYYHQISFTSKSQYRPLLPIMHLLFLLFQGACTLVTLK